MTKVTAPCLYRSSSWPKVASTLRFQKAPFSKSFIFNRIRVDGGQKCILMYEFSYKDGVFEKRNLLTTERFDNGAF